MNRWWAILPLIGVTGVPIYTALSWPVVAVAGMGFLLCALGIGLGGLTPVTTGAVFAIIGYAAALWLGDSSVNVIGAMVFGLSLLFLLDLSEFAHRLRSAEIAPDVIRGQIAYWFGRAIVIVAAVALLLVCAFFLSLLVPSVGRAVIAGSGAVVAFAGALYAGIIRTESGG